MVVKIRLGNVRGVFETQWAVGAGKRKIGADNVREYICIIRRWDEAKLRIFAVRKRPLISEGHSFHSNWFPISLRPCKLQKTSLILPYE